MGHLEREKKRWQQERELEEARLAAAIEEAEKEHARLAAALEAAEVRAALSEAELGKARSAGDKVATNVLGLSEAETRSRLIDADLTAAGWDVGVDGQSTEDLRPRQRGVGAVGGDVVKKPREHDCHLANRLLAKWAGIRGFRQPALRCHARGDQLHWTDDAKCGTWTANH